MTKEPKVNEYLFRLHRSGRPWDKRGDEVDWDAIAVGEPVRFRAIQFGESAWYANGPIVVKAPEDLESAGWTVSKGTGTVPILVGNVDRSLAEGEEFALPVTGVIVGGVLRD